MKNRLVKSPGAILEQVREAVQKRNVKSQFDWRASGAGRGERAGQLGI